MGRKPASGPQGTEPRLNQYNNHIWGLHEQKISREKEMANLSEGLVGSKAGVLMSF